MENFNIPSEDLPLYAGFVQPSLCHHLMLNGLTRRTHYHWKIYPATISLHTHAFDLDDYYIDGVKHTDVVCPPQCIFPAYALKDIEQLIGDYTLHQEAGFYKLLYQFGHKGASAQADRLPDVFAYAAISLLSNKIIAPDKANALLLKKAA